MKCIRSRVEVLTDTEVERIHRASLSILREVGIQVPNQLLLGRLRDAGAQVTGNRALLPANLVERVLGEVVGPQRRFDLDSWAVNQGDVSVTNGNEMSLLTYPEGTRRPGTCQDVLQGIALTNALPNVSHALPIVVPSDVPLPMAEIEAYRLGCIYSAKPYSVYLGLRSCPYLMRMGEAVARATGQDRRQLGLEFSFGVISPLRFAEDDLACALAMADGGWPTGCFSFLVVGASGPASMAGALALSNAERLACLVLMWLWGELGYREGHIEDPCMIDPRTLATSFGHPNLTTLTVATSQLSRYYGLGQGGGGLALSDAKGIDFQSGFERGMGAVFNMLAGGGIGNAGIVGPDEAFSLEQLVLDDAALAAVNWVMQGIEVNDDTLAVDVIREVGIGGSYLDQPHTVKHLRREFWESPLFVRYGWADWEAHDRETLLARAHREVTRLLAEHYPPKPLLPPETCEELDAILAEARAKLVVD
jgi:trimethylamine--corrinoid protein Co-methyltransferase